jgi:hypothetical protein
MHEQAEQLFIFFIFFFFMGSPDHGSSCSDEEEKGEDYEEGDGHRDYDANIEANLSKVIPAF